MGRSGCRFAPLAVSCPPAKRERCILAAATASYSMHVTNLCGVVHVVMSRVYEELHEALLTEG